MSACAGVGPEGVVAQRGDWYFYSPSYVRYVMAADDVQTSVLGAPFNMPRPQFEAQVTDGMQGHPVWAVPARYTTQPSEDARGAFWVVMAFNPPIDYNGYDACAKVDPGGGPAGGDVRVVAAFCSSVHMLSEVRASAYEVSGPDDPLFQRLIEHTMVQLLPRQAPPQRIGPSIVQSRLDQ